MRNVILPLLLLLFVACEQATTDHAQKPTIEKKEEAETNRSAEQSHKATNTGSTSSRYHAQYYYNDTLGWGYDILENETVLIHQPHIPAIQGNRGFKSEYDAERVAEKVIEKLDHNILPPRLSVEELKELGVL